MRSPAADRLPRVRRRARSLAGRGAPVPGARPVRRRVARAATTPARPAARAAPGRRQRRHRVPRSSRSAAARPRWYSGSADTHPPSLLPGSRATVRPARIGRRRGARGGRGRPGGRRGGDRHPVRRPRSRGRRGRGGGRRAAARRGRRRGHLRGQPQHQLHQRVHLPVHVLRVLQGAAVAEPARRRRTCSPSTTSPSAPGRPPGPRRHRGVPAGRHPPVASTATSTSTWCAP